MSSLKYPWYEVVKGDSLAQGDVLPDCPVFVAPSDLDVESLPSDAGQNGAPNLSFTYSRFELIVMSQTCDLVAGREKVSQVLLCPLYELEDFEKNQELATPAGWENARKGKYPAYHVLNRCELQGFNCSPKVVDFRQVFSLPLGLFRNLAVRQGDRIRLLPPYREHLSQAFARFFMRVGLPVDIQPFK